MSGATRNITFRLVGIGDPVTLNLSVDLSESPAKVLEAYAGQGLIKGLTPGALATKKDGGWNYSLQATDGPERLWVLLLGGEQLYFDWFRDLTDITLSDIEAMVAAGYLKGDPHQIIVYTDAGYGGGGDFVDLANFLFSQGVDLGIGAGLGWLSGRLTKWVRVGLRDRRARYVAWRLMDGHGLSHPGTLRQWMDTQDSWTVFDIARRLELPAETCVQLLRALGYQKDASGTWRMGTRRKHGSVDSVG